MSEVQRYKGNTLIPCPLQVPDGRWVPAVRIVPDDESKPATEHVEGCGKVWGSISGAMKDAAAHGERATLIHFGERDSEHKVGDECPCNPLEVLTVSIQ